VVLADLSFKNLSSIKITIENQKIFSIIYCMLKKILASIFWLLACSWMQILYQLQLCKFYTNILCMQELYQNPAMQFLYQILSMQKVYQIQNWNGICKGTKNVPSQSSLVLLFCLKIILYK